MYSLSENKISKDSTGEIMNCPKCNSSNIRTITEYSYCMSCDWDDLPDLSPYIEFLDYVRNRVVTEILQEWDRMDESEKTHPAITHNEWVGLRASGPSYKPKKRRKRVTQ